jgi:hypothetical protein
MKLGNVARVAFLALVVVTAGCRLNAAGLDDDSHVLVERDAGPMDTAIARDTELADTFTPVTDTFAEDTFVADTFVPDVSVACTEADAVLSSGHCYFALVAAADFTAQRDACIAAGAHLASITSAAEQAIVAPLGSGDRWIGLVKDASLPSEKSSFHWITGEPSLVYDNWAMGDPNGGHNCARMKADGMWADQACTNAYGAICERE